MQVKQFEIWNISFDPSLGQEIKKTRPALVISNSYYNLASGTIFVISLSSQKPKIENSPFHTKLSANKKNKLKKDSYTNISQLRAVSKLRFIKKVGECESQIIETLM